MSVRQGTKIFFYKSISMPLCPKNFLSILLLTSLAHQKINTHSGADETHLSKRSKGPSPPALFNGPLPLPPTSVVVPFSFSLFTPFFFFFVFPPSSCSYPTIGIQLLNGLVPGS